MTGQIGPRLVKPSAVRPVRGWTGSGLDGDMRASMGTLGTGTMAGTGIEQADLMAG